MADFPALQHEFFDFELAKQAPRIGRHRASLILYGSLRERSFSRFAAEEAGRLLTAMGASVQTFNPSGLPLPDDAPESHPKVVELRERVRWCDGMIWSSPERHGAMSAVMKAQIDWIPLSEGAVRPSQGKTLAVMQVCGGSQSFNAVNQMRNPRALDADVYYPESIVCPQSLAGV
ncbi:FMN-dependent NADPH-azoreductase [Raoultella ornithinolytica]|nr:FMN-dependent NADPH-azoreductase [Raoultella ornithinolytica]